MLLGNKAISSICLPAVATKRKSFSSLNNQLILGKVKHIYNSRKYQKYQSYFLHCIVYSKSLRLLFHNPHSALKLLFDCFGKLLIQFCS